MRWIRARAELAPWLLAGAAAALVAMPLGCNSALRAPIDGAHGDDDATPRRGGTLRLASLYDVRNLDPALPMDGLKMQAVTLLFDGLVDFDRDGRPVPNLAERWDVEDGGRFYRFTLRQGVRMHDGAELTADDVKRSVERSLSPKTPSNVTSFFESIAGYDAFAAGKAEHLEGVAVEGRYVVSFRLKQPDAAFLSLIALPAMRPVCATAGSEYSRTWLPCGAGPFRLEPGGWVRGTSLRLVRHEGYFRAGQPYLDAVEWTFAMLSIPQRIRFEQGDLDMLFDPLQPDLARYMADPRWKGLGTPLAANTIHAESMNVRRAPFDDVEVRRAVAAALDRDAFPAIKSAQIMSAHQLLPPGLPGFDPSWNCQPHDETAALEHMRRAGYAYDPATGHGGWPERISYPIFDDSTETFVAQVVQQQLSRIGLRLDLRLMTWPAWMATAQRGEEALTTEGNQADYADPSAFFEPLFTTAFISPEATNNFSFYSNARYDDLVGRARHEMDPAARKALYHEASDILCDEAPWAFTWAQRDFIMRQPYVHGFAAHPVWPFDVRGVWLDRADEGIERPLGGGLR